MLLKLFRSGSWISLGGCLILLLGLSWDGVVHKLDPALAAREGVFSLENPGHLLLGLGIGTVVAGMALFLIEKAYSLRKLSPAGGAVIVGAAFSLIALCIVSFWLTMGSSGLDVHLAASHH
ncbi:MAG TPA: hypothetical protein VH186_26725 [Chloroflexia bacterium]|nr:hypothetical protein [Chloroflexia bacterium]